VEVTCIVGLVDKDERAVSPRPRVIIGADSAGVGGYDLCVRADRKVFRNGEYLMGCTSSFRMIQLLRYKLRIERECEGDAMEHMCTTFVDAVRQCFKDGGFATKDKEAEAGGQFLVGFRGRLFQVHADYQVAESMLGYDACGCGENIARGVLYATQFEKDPLYRVRQALEAAEAHSAGVRGPFHVDAA
jgi:hypothetical protein